MASFCSQCVAMRLLKDGWTVTPSLTFGEQIQWRSPGGISGPRFVSASIDDPPDAVIMYHDNFDAQRSEGETDGSV